MPQRKLHSICFTLLAFFLFTGCQDIEYPEKPDNLIDEDKMVDVMVDAHLFNVAKGYNRVPLQNAGFDPHQFIYEKHSIDSLQYVKSNAYYAANADEYALLYTKVQQRLEKEKARVDKELEDMEVDKDSLNKETETLKKQQRKKPKIQVPKTPTIDSILN